MSILHIPGSAARQRQRLFRASGKPHSTGSAGDGVDQFGIIIAEDVGRSMFHEFWPDMKRHLFKKRKE
jgi:hypothetical protein